MKTDLENKILQIAYNMRPHLNRPVMFSDNRSEWMDLIRCAVLKKNEENKALENFIKQINIIYKVEKQVGK